MISTPSLVSRVSSLVTCLSSVHTVHTRIFIYLYLLYWLRIESRIRSNRNRIHRQKNVCVQIYEQITSVEIGKAEYISWEKIKKKYYKRKINMVIRKLYTQLSRNSFADIIGHTRTSHTHTPK